MSSRKYCDCTNVVQHAYYNLWEGYYTWQHRRAYRRHERLVKRYFHHEERLTVQVCNAHGVDCCEECAAAIKLEKDYLH